MDLDGSVFLVGGYVSGVSSTPGLGVDQYEREVRAAGLVDRVAHVILTQIFHIRTEVLSISIGSRKFIDTHPAPANGVGDVVRVEIGDLLTNHDAVRLFDLPVHERQLPDAMAGLKSDSRERLVLLDGVFRGYRSRCHAAGE